MSLIHEALRKARRESAEKDALGVVYSRGLTGRRGRPGVGSGIALGILLTVAVGAVVGGALWLRLGGHRESSAAPVETAVGPRVATPSRGSTADASRPESIPSSPTRSDAATPDQPSPQALDERSDGPAPTPRAAPPSEPVRATSGPAAAGPTPGQDAAAHGDGRPTHAPGAPIRPTGKGGGRVFEVEANLGYATLTLDYIVFRPTDPFAQINGVDVRVGSTIEGFTVDEIGRSSVKLHDARGPLIIQVP